MDDLGDLLLAWAEILDGLGESLKNIDRSHAQNKNWVFSLGHRASSPAVTSLKIKKRIFGSRGALAIVFSNND